MHKRKHIVDLRLQKNGLAQHAPLCSRQTTLAAFMATVKSLFLCSASETYTVCISNHTHAYTTLTNLLASRYPGILHFFLQSNRLFTVRVDECFRLPLLLSTSGVILLFFSGFTLIQIQAISNCFDPLCEQHGCPEKFFHWFRNNIILTRGCKFLLIEH